MYKSKNYKLDFVTGSWNISKINYKIVDGIKTDIETSIVPIAFYVSLDKAVERLIEFESEKKDLQSFLVEYKNLKKNIIEELKNSVPELESLLEDIKKANLENRKFSAPKEVLEEEEAEKEEEKVPQIDRIVPVGNITYTW